MSQSRLDAKQFVTGLSAAEMEQLLSALIQRYWSEWPINRPSIISVQGPDDKVIAHVTYPVRGEEDPEMAEFLARARERAKDPNRKFVSFEEFEELLKQRFAEARAAVSS